LTGAGLIAAGGLSAAAGSVMALWMPINKNL